MIATPDIAIWIPVLSFSAAIPLLCYLDVRYREIPPIIWLVLLSVNLPTAAFMYFKGFYPQESLIVSLLAICLLFVMMVKNYIQGADFYFLALIMSFFVVNPYPLPHGIMILPFMVFLFAMSVVTAIAIFSWNYVRMKGDTSMGLIGMASHFPNGVPYMVTISAAFIITVMFG